MWRLAGNTAISVAINHHPPSFRVAGERSAAPPAISATPLAYTIASGAGM